MRLKIAHLSECVDVTTVATDKWDDCLLHPAEAASRYL